MKLQFLIPQYNETDEVVRPLLDSIAIQQNISMDDIGAVICNDGSDIRLSDSLLSSYPFKIEYHICEHRGVSATRNSCLDNAKADYVMFCDADDMLYNACGLYVIFREIDKGFDTLTSVFIEESRQNGDVLYVTHDMDCTFVHGKVHRREYLIENCIRWNDSLTIHEDSYFNCLCQRIASNALYCPTPFYLWRWRNNSVCRHDKLYINKTYVNMLDSSTELVNELLRRGRKDDAIFYATSMIYDTYYSMNCDKWWSDDGASYRKNTEYRFAQYWRDFKYLYNDCHENIMAKIIVGIRNRFFKEGLLLERITFMDWIKHIESL